MVGVRRNKYYWRQLGLVIGGGAVFRLRLSRESQRRGEILGTHQRYRLAIFRQPEAVGEMLICRERLLIWHLVNINHVVFAVASILCDRSAAEISDGFLVDGRAVAQFGIADHSSLLVTVVFNEVEDNLTHSHIHLVCCDGLASLDLSLAGRQAKSAYTVSCEAL